MDNINFKIIALEEEIMFWSMLVIFKNSDFGLYPSLTVEEFKVTHWCILSCSLSFNVTAEGFEFWLFWMFCVFSSFTLKYAHEQYFPTQNKTGNYNLFCWMIFSITTVVHITWQYCWLLCRWSSGIEGVLYDVGSLGDIEVSADDMGSFE